MAENYKLRYQGYEFYVTMDTAGPTTTLGPNVRVIEGTWKTWYIEPGEAPDWEIRILRSVNPANPGAQHPAGNLSYEASGSLLGEVLMHDDDGYLKRAPIGYAIIGRLLNN